MRLLCKLGLHSWYTDAAMYTSVRRCNYCGKVDNETDAKKLAQEREFWESSVDEREEIPWPNIVPENEEI